MQIITESMKIKKLCVSSSILELEFKFSKISSMRSKALCLGLSKPTKWLTAQSTAYALRQLGKHAFVKKKKKLKKYICKRNLQYP